MYPKLTSRSYRWVVPGQLCVCPRGKTSKKSICVWAPDVHLTNYLSLIEQQNLQPCAGCMSFLSSRGPQFLFLFKANGLTVSFPLPCWASFLSRHGEVRMVLAARSVKNNRLTVEIWGVWVTFHADGEVICPGQTWWENGKYNVSVLSCSWRICFFNPSLWFR